MASFNSKSCLVRKLACQRVLQKQIKLFKVKTCPCGRHLNVAAKNLSQDSAINSARHHAALCLLMLLNLTGATYSRQTSCLVYNNLDEFSNIGLGANAALLTSRNRCTTKKPMQTGLAPERAANCADQTPKTRNLQSPQYVSSHLLLIWQVHNQV